jgi:hypothetical protein
MQPPMSGASPSTILMAEIIDLGAPNQAQVAHTSELRAWTRGDHDETAGARLLRGEDAAVVVDADGGRGETRPVEHHVTRFAPRAITVPHSVARVTPCVT